jgi:hypothetical protein
MCKISRKRSQHANGSAENTESNGRACRQELEAIVLGDEGFGNVQINVYMLASKSFGAVDDAHAEVRARTVVLETNCSRMPRCR